MLQWRWRSVLIFRGRERRILLLLPSPFPHRFCKANKLSQAFFIFLNCLHCGSSLAHGYLQVIIESQQFFIVNT